MAKETFEEALKKLEEIVTQLEQGDLSLDKSLKLFEEGIRLSHRCTKKLDEAEKKVEILLKGSGGKQSTQTFELEEKEDT